MTPTNLLSFEVSTQSGESHSLKDILLMPLKGASGIIHWMMALGTDNCSKCGKLVSR